MGEDAQLCENLARALGFDDSDGFQSSTPYITHILSQWPGRAPKSAYIDLFIRVVEAFTKHIDGDGPSIQLCIDHFIAGEDEYFKSGPQADQLRSRAISGTILFILGSWLLMPRYFMPLVHGSLQRHIILAYCKKNNLEYDEGLALELPLPVLMTESGLLPDPRETRWLTPNDALDDTAASGSLPFNGFELHMMNDIESLSIDPRDLNAYRLLTIGGLRFHWTDNISRHLLLTSHGGATHLEIFALPCAIHGGAEDMLSRAGIPREVTQDIKNSYANLFNPCKPSRIHQLARVPLLMGHWCWCVSCASRRLKKGELSRIKSSNAIKPDASGSARTIPFDPLLDTLMGENPSNWDPTEFPTLWPRLLVLNEHMQRSKPWSFWILFRDNRDTLQYWTFLFGTLILILTVTQVLLAIAQTAGSFLGT